METCLLTERWTAYRWHELNTGICTERGNPRLDVKRGFQAEEPQEKSIDASMGADCSRSSEETSVMEGERRATSYLVSRISQL